MEVFERNQELGNWEGRTLVGVGAAGPERRVGGGRGVGGRKEVRNRESVRDSDAASDQETMGSFKSLCFQTSAALCVLAPL